ncbi:MAG: two-component system response regulator BaeR [Granulosicoccus sp.]|jgi:two-component system response regulator BaeR
MNITIVEDEPKLASLLQDYLHRDGFDTTIYHDGGEALRSLVNAPPDLVLLDLMLPGTDGMTICKELRKSSNVPIIMLTARVEEIDRLLGLEVGADDYICKPFSPREVVARVKAVLRRTGGSNPTDEADTSDSTESPFQLNENTASVHIGDRACSLTAVELRLLGVMHERQGQIFNRAQLMRRMYEDNRIVSDRTIDSHVKKLRQKLEAIDQSTTYIHSVYGIGYKFEIIENDVNA